MTKIWLIGGAAFLAILVIASIIVALIQTEQTLTEGSLVLALGGIAHRAIIRALGLRQAAFKFGHAAEHRVDERFLLLDSYHCSRYNTNTRRLTTAMFRDIFARIKQHLDRE